MATGSFERLMGGEAVRERDRAKGLSGSWVGDKQLTVAEANKRYGEKQGQKALNELLALQKKAADRGFDSVQAYRADARIDKDPYEVVNSLAINNPMYRTVQAKNGPGAPSQYQKPASPGVMTTAAPAATNQAPVSFVAGKGLTSPISNPQTTAERALQREQQIHDARKAGNWDQWRQLTGNTSSNAYTQTPKQTAPGTTPAAAPAPTTAQPAAQAPAAAPNYNYNPTPFSAPQYNQLSFGDALKQAQGQLDPIYQRALQDIEAQRFANSQVAGQQGALNGVGHSGLAADAQNKLRIAAQNQVGNAGLQRASQSAQMAQALVDSDFQRAMALRNQALQEYMGQNGVNLDAARFNYGQYRDTQGDAFRDKQFDWQKYMGQQDVDYRNRQFDWQRSTDQRDFDFNKWLQEAMLTGRVYV